MNKINMYCKLFLRKYKKIKKCKIKSLKQENKYLKKILANNLIKDEMKIKIICRIEANNKIIYPKRRRMDKILKIICSKINPFIHEEINNDDLEIYLNTIEYYLSNNILIYEIINKIDNINYKINEKSLEDAIKELKFEMCICNYKSNKFDRLKDFSKYLDKINK